MKIEILLCILVMALTTYLIRALPLVLMKKPVKNRFVRSFLHYVPPACLAAMTFPAILYYTGGTDIKVSGIVGLGVSVILALCKRSLVVVAVAGCAAVFLTELLLRFL